jgi:hypothetical protein
MCRPFALVGRPRSRGASSLPRVALACLILLCAFSTAAAQELPSGPITAFDGRLVVGAEVSASVGSSDENAYFNYTDYEHNALRLFRAAVAASWRPASRIALVGEVRTEDFNLVRPYAAYVRIRPWSGIDFDIQAGQIPPSFGAYGRRGYQSNDNGLIGYPLAYQYLTAMRADAAPASLADLLAMRARGWRLSYPLGSQQAGPGVPLISAFRWDTGVQGHWHGRMIDVTAGVTSGTLSDPHVEDNNSGKQFSGRVALSPITGLIVGASTARGEFLAKAVTRQLQDTPGSRAQTALGADAEYSRDHWLVRGEMVWSRWNVPMVATRSSIDLDAIGYWIEGRYRLTPRIVVAARADRLDFSDVPLGSGATDTWDANVRRVEADAGYYFRRNLVFRVAVQHNDRDGGRDRKRTYVSGQLAYWF